MAKPGFEARLAAQRLLHAVLYDFRRLSEVLDYSDSPIIGLEPADRARAQSLVTTCLRNLDRVDRVLKQHLKKKPPFAVMNVLRLCATEILIDGIAPHAAVDGAVSLVKLKKKTAYFSGLVNAVARKLVDEGQVEFDKAPVQKLPKDFRQSIKKTYGFEVCAAIEQAHQAGAPMDLTFKDVSQAQSFADAQDAILLPNGTVRLQSRVQISALDGYETGDWWVQDAAASLPALALGDVKGKTVLDLCAAPGGKTMQLAARGADVTALDLSERRLERVTQNLERVKLKATIVAADALEWETEQQFDAVLIDAPCSASGTVRRHPDLPFLNARLDLRGLVDLQREMIKKATHWIKPGGYLLFSTCSLYPNEGEAQADWITQEFPQFSTVPLSPDEYGLPAQAAGQNGTLRLRPDMWAESGGMDGFFIAKFQRNA